MGWGDKRRRKNATPGTLFLDRWKQAAASRRMRLEGILATGSVNEMKRAELQAWCKSLTAKRAWLVARLEHVSEMEKLLEAALKEKK